MQTTTAYPADRRRFVRMLPALVVGLAGLTRRETAAQRRPQRRKPRRAAQGQTRGEVTAAYWVIGGGGPGPGPGI
jgi:hypothetical protein